MEISGETWSTSEYLVLSVLVRRKFGQGGVISNVVQISSTSPAGAHKPQTCQQHFAYTFFHPCIATKSTPQVHADSPLPKFVEFNHDWKLGKLLGSCRLYHDRVSAKAPTSWVLELGIQCMKFQLCSVWFSERIVGLAYARNSPIDFISVSNPGETLAWRLSAWIRTLRKETLRMAEAGSFVDERVSNARARIPTAYLNVEQFSTLAHLFMPCFSQWSYF